MKHMKAMKESKVSSVGFNSMLLAYMLKLHSYTMSFVKLDDI